MTTISVNIEGLSSFKEELFQNLCRTKKCDLLCIQETHRDVHQARLPIHGMRLIAERAHRQYGSVVFGNPDIRVINVSVSGKSDLGIITVELSNLTVTSIYKLLDTPLSVISVGDQDREKPSVFVGDFNSHSCMWGYAKDDADGRLVLRWAESHRLSLIHDS